MAHPISEFSECRGCGFVLHAESGADPEPKHWEACPACGAREFTFADG